MLKYLCFTVMVLPSVTVAEHERGPRQVHDTNFDTRQEALETLLPNDVRGPGEDATQTGCAIGVTPGDLTGRSFLTGKMVTGPIGRNLSRHCANGNNQASGVALGGGLGSSQPFRTVGIPELDRAQDDAGDESENGLNFLGNADGNVALRFASRGSQFYFETFRGDFTLAGTRYGLPADADGTGLALGTASTNDGGTGTLGAVFTYTNYKGNFASNLDVNATFDENPILDELAKRYNTSFAKICGIRGGGTFDSRKVALRVNGREELGRGVLVDYGIGASRTRDNFAIQNCIVSALVGPQLSLNEVFAGTLRGNPVTLTADAFVTVEQRLEFGAASIIPSAGLSLVSMRRKGFSEAEQPAGTMINFPGVSEQVRPTQPLGTALIFDDSQTSRAELRFGLDYEVPFQVASAVGSLRLGGGVTRLFGDGQERVTARFLEDGRDNPLRFSFLGRPVDRTWGDVSVGVSLPLGDRGRISVGAETMVGNAFIDHTTIHAGLAVAF
ncbi:autotransporter outer membrane beta-barrel domain-containing protein [Paracoccus tibetensis]|uniref:Autotransporter beta-domain-containing protein n=1 Tax=Paracoccus tibetensis TaxID=336292 RepID=A0A1G5K099_9RHOB|nr:autotransporter outer membrane beta-barrel domain-containing protein [Paracoccus tibetensis]SCY94112.1 Autotransporter beta-domain-containing protein [Paracoccus tibetensis]